MVSGPAARACKTRVRPPPLFPPPPSPLFAPWANRNLSRSKHLSVSTSLNQLTLSASQAAAQAKSSSLYKSAGGALSSLLTTFVDESYYSSNTNNRGSGQDASALTPPSLGNPTGGVAERPLRCAVAELGETLAGQGARGRGGGGGRGGGNGGGCSSLKAVGLARTGLTERDAARLAAALRARPVDSPLEEVEVGGWRGFGAMGVGGGDQGAGAAV